MINIKKISLFCLILLTLFIIPISFASDLNDVQDDVYTHDVDGENILSGQEIYFNASAEVDGDGSQENPYKVLNTQRIGYGNTLYFANGIYNLTRAASVNTAVFIGEDAEKTIINQNGRGLSVSTSLTLENITFYKSSITSSGAKIIASNTIFNGGEAKVTDKYDGSFGGAISNFASSDYHSYAYYPELYLDNCTFINNNAVYGGAIYIESGNANITNSKFIENIADNFGGAITIFDGSKVNIENTIFDGDYSKSGEAGAIYITKSKLTMKNSTIKNCLATIGAGICDLNATVGIDSLKAYNNTAMYYGGVIYKMYGSISIDNSKFEKNGAKNGGAVYVDDASHFVLTNNIFNSNNASLYAGALYSLANSERDFSNNVYENNSAAKYNDELITDEYDLNIGSGIYDMFNYISKYNGTLPERYNLIDDGYVTPLANQQTSGNCWAFASIAALESCILKASNITYDLSEENMKNLIEIFSDYGWDMETNNGGFDEMAIGYLTSWLGPVNESSDIFDDYSLISPVINSIMHVQNILYLGRSSFTDNDAIKKAILDYGAVVTGMFYDNYYLSSNGAYYYAGSTYANHAVTIVGWDDNYSRENFLSNPRGDGAWIIKNSWGETWGDEGYFYASYYDGVIARVGDPHYLYTFILNDSIRLDKNYQYDISGVTDYFVTGKDVIWYENIFNATDNELLSAFSTYFNTTTDWEAYIYVNDDLKLVQNGSAISGYFTIYLNQFIPLKVGDIFKIALKINASGFASFPISENINFIRTLYKPNISFFSYDGEEWFDLYDYTLVGYDHSYSSQVACLKAFTSFTYLNSTLTIDDYNVTVKTPVSITAKVLDNYGNNISRGIVKFVIDNKTYESDVVDGIANITLSFDKLGEFDIEAFFESDSLINPSNSTSKLNVSKSDVKLSINISDILTYEDIVANITFKALNNENINGTVVLTLNNKKYELDIQNNKSSYIISDFVPAGFYEVLVSFNGSDKYYRISNSTNFTITNRSVEMNLSLEVIDVKYLLINVSLNDTINGTFDALVNNESYEINLTSGSGQLFLKDLDYGNYTVNVLFSKEGYFSSNVSDEIELKPVKTYLITSDVEMYFMDGSRFKVILMDENNNTISNQSLLFFINNMNYTRTTDENGSASMALNLNSQNYTMVVKFNGTDIYTNCESANNITIKATLIADDVVKYYRNDTQFYVSVLDSNGVPVIGKNVIFNINGVYYNRTTNDKGIARLNLNLNPGEYVLTTINSITGENSANNITILSRIVENYDLVKYYRNSSQYTLKILDKQGNPLSERTVKFNINGVFYYRESNSEGIVKMNINLSPGEYIITAEYDGYRVSNNITVLSVIEADDLEMHYLDGSQFNVRLLDDAGKSAADKEVTFNINGVFYNRISDSDGIAHLNINLMSGEYIITSTYNNLNVANKITII